MLDPSPPPNFDEAFLEWFGTATEAAWAIYEPVTLEDYQARGVGGQDWQRGTRWIGGLSDEEIAAAERRWAVRFPPDYRLFLRTLHTVDRPQLGAYFVDKERLGPCERASFSDWRSGREGPPRLYEGVLGAFEWLFEGIYFDIEQTNLWLPSWGAKPPTESERQERLRALLATAPKLIPIYHHRYLLAEPYRSGNPVLSIWQSDIIVFGGDLRDYFRWEFSHLLPRVPPSTRRQQNAEYFAGCEAAYGVVTALPFWGEIITNRSRPSR